MNFVKQTLLSVAAVFCTTQAVQAQNQYKQAEKEYKKLIFNETLKPAFMYDTDAPRVSKKFYDQEFSKSKMPSAVLDSVRTEDNLIKVYHSSNNTVLDKMGKPYDKASQAHSTTVFEDTNKNRMLDEGDQKIATVIQAYGNMLTSDGRSVQSVHLEIDNDIKNNPNQFIISKTVMRDGQPVTEAALPTRDRGFQLIDNALDAQKLGGAYFKMAFGDYLFKNGIEELTQHPDAIAQELLSKGKTMPTQGLVPDAQGNLRPLQFKNPGL